MAHLKLRSHQPSSDPTCIRPNVMVPRYQITDFCQMFAQDPEKVSIFYRPILIVHTTDRHILAETCLNSWNRWGSPQTQEPPTIFGSNVHCIFVGYLGPWDSVSVAQMVLCGQPRILLMLMSQVRTSVRSFYS